MEIITSKVSVYEVEVDLKQWEKVDSNQVPGFYQALSQTIESIKEHKCMSGEPGGFLTELRNGTNFAHVIEHVILELIHLVDPQKEIYSGWTREKGDSIYVIHYGAPDFLTGRLAAILAVDLVKQLIEGKHVDLNHYLKLLKDPVKYYTADERLSAKAHGFVEPVSVIEEIEGGSRSETETRPSLILSDSQIENLKAMLTGARDHLPKIDQLWRKSFIEYCGNFGWAIVDKIELVNIDKFMDFIAAGDFRSFFRGVRNVSHLLKSYRIPIHFVIHSIWLYKNSLFDFAVAEQKHDKHLLHRAIQDVEDFYQVIYQHASEGYSAQPLPESVRYLNRFKEVSRGKIRVLVVDDDEMARTVFRDVLEYHGYQTVLAENGEQAIEILSDPRSDIALIVLDLLMPGLSGKDVYEATRKMHPSMNVVVSSGYPIDSDLHKLFTGENVSFVSKPFSLEEFLAKIRSGLLASGTYYL